MGYGIDSSSIVSGLVSAVRDPKDKALSAKESKVGAQISAIANASAALNNFATALTQLLSTSEYSRKPASSDPSIPAVSLPEDGALYGLPVEMEVKQRANSQVLKSPTPADRSTAVGLGQLPLPKAATSGRRPSRNT